MLERIRSYTWYKRILKILRRYIKSDKAFQKSSSIIKLQDYINEIIYYNKIKYIIPESEYKYLTKKLDKLFYEFSEILFNCHINKNKQLANEVVTCFCNNVIHDIDNYYLKNLYNGFYEEKVRIYDKYFESYIQKLINQFPEFESKLSNVSNFYKVKLMQIVCNSYPEYMSLIDTYLGISENTKKVKKDEIIEDILLKFKCEHIENRIRTIIYLLKKMLKLDLF